MNLVNLVLLVAFILGAEDLIQFSIMGCSQWYSYMRFACNARNLGLIPGLGRFPGGGGGNPLQYSCLENPHGRGA